MSKYRIYQLAKEFSLDSKKIIDILNKNNINVSNNLNLVGEKEREVIASIVNNKDNNKQQTAKKNNQQNVNHKNNNSANNNNNNNKQDTSWVGSLNNWIQKVAAGFQSIYNGNSGKKDEASLTKSIALNSLSVGTTSLDINYAITDPENKYNVVYAIVSDGTKQTSISLDKNATSYKVTGLEPNTNYSVVIGRSKNNTAAMGSANSP